MTSSTKSEVHNVYATPPEEYQEAATGNVLRNVVVKCGRVVLEICSRIHGNRQTDRHIRSSVITILGSPTRDGVKTESNEVVKDCQNYFAIDLPSCVF